MASLLGDAAVAALVAVGRTLAICVCGFVLARYRVKAGGAASWRDFARLNAEFFTPCLCLAMFPKGVNPAALRELWPVVVLGVLLPCLWLVVGAAGTVLLLPREERRLARFVAVTVAYPNAMALPYPLMMALTRQVPWLNAREDADAYSATVSVLFSIVMLLQIWTVAFGLYGAAPKAAPTPTLAKPASGAEGGGDAGDASVDDVELSFDPAPKTVGAGAVRPMRSSMSMQSSTSMQSVRRSVTHSMLVTMGGARSVKEIMNPLLVSLLLALVIAMSPMREPFLGSVVHEVLEFVGNGAVPLTLVLMGAGMARPPDLAQGGAELRWRSAMIVVFLRLVVANVIGALVVTGCRQMGWLQDPHLALCMYLMCCSPTAANVGLVSSVQQAYVQPTALVLFLMHIFAIPVMTLSIAVYIAILP